MSTGTITSLPVADIQLVRALQAGAKLDPFTIDRYAADMAEDVEMPPVTVFLCDGAYWCVDGFHRVSAAQQAGIVSIAAHVREGTLRDAVLFAVGANAAHGLRRTSLDKRHAVRMLLEDKEWGQWSDREIARACHVHHGTVGSVRSSLAKSASDRKYRTKGGVIATMDTRRIGRNKPPRVTKARDLTPEVRELIADTPVAEDEHQVQLLARQPEDGVGAIADKIASGESRTVSKAISQLHRDEAARHGETATLPSSTQVITGDCVDVMADMEPDSVDLIFTDPPYDKETAPLYGDLARLGGRVLKEGGSLIAYAGQHALPGILSRMGEHLDYLWMAALTMPGGAHASLGGHQLVVTWKPLVWFTKGRRRRGEFVRDSVASEGVEKRFHDWEQGAAEAFYYIDKLTKPGEIVLDAFCGSGTTCLVAHRLGRQSIGIEKEARTGNIARAKIYQGVSSEEFAAD